MSSRRDDNISTSGNAYVELNLGGVDGVVLDGQPNAPSTEPFTIWANKNDNTLRFGSIDLTSQGQSSVGDTNTIQLSDGSGGFNSNTKLTWDDSNSGLIVDGVAYHSLNINGLNPDYPKSCLISPTKSNGTYGGDAGFNIFNLGGNSDSWWNTLNIEPNALTADQHTSQNSGVYMRASANSRGGFNLASYTISPTRTRMLSYNSYYDTAGNLRVVKDNDATSITKESNGDMVIWNAEPGSAAGDALNEHTRFNSVGGVEISLFNQLVGLSCLSVDSVTTGRNVVQSGTDVVSSGGSDMASAVKHNADGSLELLVQKEGSDDTLWTNLKAYPAGAIKAPRLSTTSSTYTGTKYLMGWASDYGGSLMPITSFSTTSSSSSKYPLYVNSSGIVYEYTSALKFKSITDENPQIDSSFINDLHLVRFDDTQTTPIENTLGLIADRIYAMGGNATECVSFKHFTNTTDPESPDFTDVNEEGNPIPHGPVLNKTVDGENYKWDEIHAIDHIRLLYYAIDYIQTLTAEIADLSANQEILQNDYAALLSRVEALEN